MTPVSSVPHHAYAWPQPCRSAGYWPPDPNDFPPWLEKRGDWVWCCACWKYADKWHVLTAEHFRRVRIRNWRQKQHSIAFPAVRAEAWPSNARSPTKSADSDSVYQSDLAELRGLLHEGQRSAWAKRVPSDMLSAADRTDGETVSHNVLADLFAFLNSLILTRFGTIVPSCFFLFSRCFHMFFIRDFVAFCRVLDLVLSCLSSKFLSVLLFVTQWLATFQRHHLGQLGSNRSRRWLYC